MDRDPRENTIDPEERKTPSSGAHTTAATSSFNVSVAGSCITKRNAVTVSGCGMRE